MILETGVVEVPPTAAGSVGHFPGRLVTGASYRDRRTHFIPEARDGTGPHLAESVRSLPQFRKVASCTRDSPIAHVEESVEENANGRPNYKALRQAGLDHPIEKVGAELRDMMPFTTAGKQKIQDISGG